MNSTRHLVRTSALAMALVFGCSSIVLAADGVLDTTFGTNGIVTTVMGVANDIIQDIVIQPDGKIVAVGSASGTGGGFAIARYNPDGSLDTTFDTDGKLLLAPGTAANSNLAHAVALQADGKIVVVGQGTNTGGSTDFAVIRLNANGTLDTTFDGDGIAITAVSASGVDIARAVEIQTDGKIVVAGSASVTDLDFALVRYNTDGSLDATFDTDGKVTTNVVSGQQDVAYSLSIQADGKIVSAGGSYPTLLNDDYAIVRYNADGSLDTTFDTDGIVIASTGGLDRVNRVLIQPDGKILCGGHGSMPPINTSLNFVLLRFNADGSPDTSFDTDGIAWLLINASSAIYDIVLQPDGKVIAAGVNSTGTTNSVNFALARFNSNGGLDTSFGTDGIVNTPVSPTFSDQAFAMRLQANGKITVAGEVNTTSSNKDFAVARYQAFTPTGELEGDLAPRPNGDGVVLVTDVIQMRRFATGLDTPNPAFNEPQRADCSPRATFGDGIIDSTDVIQARRYATNLDPQTNAGGPIGPPSIATRSAVEGELAQPEGGRAIDIVSAKTSNANRITLNVRLSSSGDEMAANFTLHFDPELLKNPSVESGTLLPPGTSITTNDLDPGRISILLDSSEPLAKRSASVTLVAVSFDLKSDTKPERAFVTFDNSDNNAVSDAFGNPLRTVYSGATIPFYTRLSWVRFPFEM